MSTKKESCSTSTERFAQLDKWMFLCTWLYIEISYINIAQAKYNKCDYQKEKWVDTINLDKFYTARNFMLSNITMVQAEDLVLAGLKFFSCIKSCAGVQFDRK